MKTDIFLVGTTNDLFQIDLAVACRKQQHGAGKGVWPKP
jgi:hypothetical protein